jgi:predicted NAD/FAD-binding protein
MAADALPIAVIGAGAAGLTAAHLLGQTRRVLLFEASGRLGGHAMTVEVPDGPDRGLPLDLGFMVLNNRTYPSLLRLFERLGCIEVAPTEMSFGYHDHGSAFSYALNWSHENSFARQTNAAGARVDPAFGRLVRDILRFQRRASEDLRRDDLGAVSLDAYLASIGASSLLRERYLIPMSAAIWSTSARTMLSFPAEPFLRFFANHGLLDADAGLSWHCVVGGSRRYVEAIRSQTPGLEILPRRVAAIRRHADHVKIIDAGGATVIADHVVVATHADEALALLDDADEEERAGLAPWRYQANHGVFHRDQRLMPPSRADWASWNYRETGHAGGLSVTYHLNRLQNARLAHHQYFMTVADDSGLPQIDPALTYERRVLHTPVFSAQSIAARAVLASRQGKRRTFLCGSYLGNGFHEDAVASGASVAAAFGAML